MFMFKSYSPVSNLWGKEKVGMDCRNLSKSLKGEERFFKSNACKSGKLKSEMGGEICSKMEFCPSAISHRSLS